MPTNTFTWNGLPTRLDLETISGDPFDGTLTIEGPNSAVVDLSGYTMEVAVIDRRSRTVLATATLDTTDAATGTIGIELSAAQTALFDGRECRWWVRATDGGTFFDGAVVAPLRGEAGVARFTNGSNYVAIAQAVVSGSGGGSGDAYPIYDLLSDALRVAWNAPDGDLRLRHVEIDDAAIPGAARIAANGILSAGSATNFDMPLCPGTVDGQRYVWTHTGGPAGGPLRIRVSARGELEWDTRTDCTLQGFPTDIWGADDSDVVWAGISGIVHYDSANSISVALAHVENGDDPGHWIMGAAYSTDADADDGGTWHWLGRILDHESTSGALTSSLAHQTMGQCFYGTDRSDEGGEDLSGKLVGICTETTAALEQRNVCRFRVDLPGLIAWAVADRDATTPTPIVAEKDQSGSWVDGLTGGAATLIPGSDGIWLHGFQMFANVDGTIQIVSPYDNGASGWSLRQWTSSDQLATIEGPYTIDQPEHGNWDAAVTPDYLGVVGLDSRLRPGHPSLQLVALLRTTGDLWGAPTPPISIGRITPVVAPVDLSMLPRGEEGVSSVFIIIDAEDGDFVNAGLPGQPTFVSSGSTWTGGSVLPPGAGVILFCQTDDTQNGLWTVNDDGDAFDPDSRVDLFDDGGNGSEYVGALYQATSYSNGTVTSSGTVVQVEYSIANDDNRLKVLIGPGATIGELVEDTTPQLGGDLDLNGNSILGIGRPLLAAARFNGTNETVPLFDYNANNLDASRTIIAGQMFLCLFAGMASPLSRIDVEIVSAGGAGEFLHVGWWELLADGGPGEIIGSTTALPSDVTGRSSVAVASTLPHQGALGILNPTGNATVTLYAAYPLLKWAAYFGSMPAGLQRAGTADATGLASLPPDLTGYTFGQSTSTSSRLRLQATTMPIIGGRG